MSLFKFNELLQFVIAPTKENYNKDIVNYIIAHGYASQFTSWMQHRGED